MMFIDISFLLLWKQTASILSLPNAVEIWGIIALLISMALEF